MMGSRWRIGLGIGALALLAPLWAAGGPAAAPAGQPHRSPADVAVSPDGRWAVTANQSAGTASLVDLQAGRVAGEVPVGERPYAAAFTPDGRQVVVTGTWSGTLSLLRLQAGKLEKQAEIAVGPEPRGVVLSRDGKTAFVALTTADAVAVVDLPAAAVRRRVAVGRRPWDLGISPDGSRLVVPHTRDYKASMIDTATLSVVRVLHAGGKNHRQVSVAPGGDWAYVPNIIQPTGFPVTARNIDIGWVLASRITRLPLHPDAAGDWPAMETLALDPRGKAVGDPCGMAVSPDGQLLAMSAAGTHELLLLRLPLPFSAFASPHDHIEPELLRGDGRFRRVDLGGRPMGIRFSADGRRVFVANYLDDSVQVVDTGTGSVERRIDLGHPAEISLARRGEGIFYDAQRSMNQWFSCSSCHVDGHTNGLLADTLNDGQHGNGSKKTLSLRGVAATGPWTWHGWQTDLAAAVNHSLVTTMNGPAPGPGDAEAVVAFLATLTDPPNPNCGPRGELTPAQKQGEQLFKGDAGCLACHSGPRFTSPQVVDVGLGEPRDRYPGYNPPALAGVFDHFPYLHDGRALTLRDALTQYHSPAKLGAKRELTAAELDALIDYLNSL